MNPLHLPNLKPEEIGVYQRPGWFLQDSKFFASKQEPILQCPQTHLNSLPSHSIDINGVVSASAKCHSCDFHQWVIFDNWPKNLVKKAGDIKRESFCVELVA